jgi:4-hydroxybenzoate polyprenyltransferase
MAKTSIGAAAVAWLLGGIGTCCLFFLPILSLGTYCTGPIFLIGNIVAAVTGFMARRQIKEEGGSKEDEQWANVGMILGVIGTFLGIGLICLLVLSLAGFAGLTLLSPEVGNVFSEINRELTTPVP